MSFIFIRSIMLKARRGRPYGNKEVFFNIRILRVLFSISVTEKFFVRKMKENTEYFTPIYIKDIQMIIYISKYIQKLIFVLHLGL